MDDGDAPSSPLIVAKGMSTAIDRAGAVTVQLPDNKGKIHTLRLTSAAAVGLCVMLSNHSDAKQALAELYSSRPFRVDQFAPAIEIKVEPKTDVDRLKLGAALSALAVDNAQFCFAMNEPTVAILGAIDETKLAQLLELIQGVHNVAITVGSPQVAYRERITRQAEIEYTHKKQTQGVGEFARIKLLLEPTPQDYGHTFLGVRARGILPENFIEAVEKGVRSSTAAGTLEGFPVIGMRVLLVDAAAHDTDSTPLAFQIAASVAVREGVRHGDPKIVEPIMRVEIVAPQDCLTAIVDDLKARRGVFEERGRHSSRGIVLPVSVPAATLFGYENILKAITRGRATFTIQFERYATLPDRDDPSFRPAAAIRA